MPSEMTATSVTLGGADVGLAFVIGGDSREPDLEEVAGLLSDVWTLSLVAGLAVFFEEKSEKRDFFLVSGVFVDGDEDGVDFFMIPTTNWKGQ